MVNLSEYDFCTFLQQQSRSRNTTDTGTKHQYFFVFKLHVYTPINAIRQSSAVTIENTATTLVSDQPHNSK